MKNFIKILILIVLLFISVNSFAQGIDMSVFDDIDDVSIETQGTGDAVDTVKDIGLSLLKSVKSVLMGVFVIFMVYTGIMMIISKGSDEEELSKAKRQIWYSVVAILFINIPGTLYDSFNTTVVDPTASIGNTWKDSPINMGNIFFDFNTFNNTLGNKIIGFLRVLIFGIAIFFIMLSGINILTSRGREDAIKESKMKIVYSVFALIFVGFIGAWQNLVFSGNIGTGTSLFADMANLALFLAAPVAIFFLTVAAYYYIISAGDEEKIKKAKSIVINTVIATIILLAAYSFLLDLADLAF